MHCSLSKVFPIINTSLSPNGSDSTVLRLDLTKQTSIPKDAKVKRINTAATQTPSQGNTRHCIMSEENKVWHRALANSKIDYEKCEIKD
ncbi:hypothetical protein BAGQ_0237 [Bacillus velezensis]|nr:hypothetical protein BCBMB205_01850 [Bacillus velezensis]ARZ56506.1 hypothetical protein BAGQ_0237 [Bacillus velezensis]